MEATAVTESKGEFLGHPKALFVLFSTELWERFSFYSMRAFLVLYMTKAMLVSQQTSNEIYGAYLGFVYAAPFLGGMLADRLWGQRRCIVTGGILMALSQFALAFHAFQVKTLGTSSTLPLNLLFFLALGLLSAGNGFFKPNISTIVGSLYPQGDARRDGAFTIFYMGINIGAFLAGFSGQIAENYGWHFGFGLAGIGMVIGQVIFFFGGHLLQEKGLPTNPQKLREPWHFGIPKSAAIAFAVILFIPVAGFLIGNPKYVQNLAVIVALPILVYLLWEVKQAIKVEGERMIVLIVLTSFSLLFWAFFDIAGSAVNLFTDAHVQRTVPIFGELKASFLTASVNPFFIILLGIPFAKLWVWLNKKQMEPSSPLKFSLGLLQIAAGYFVFYLGAIQAGEAGRCNLSFLILGFLLHTTGELCLSPVGLSTVTKLSPARMVSTFMGVWFLATALGDILGGWIGGKTEHSGFATVFLWITISGGAAGLLLAAFIRPLKRMMHGVK